MTRCTQPGCTGTIVDGYCDVCGSPGPVWHFPRCPEREPRSAGGNDADLSGARCTQPGCTGTVVDGYWVMYAAALRHPQASRLPRIRRR